ncbi:MAG: glycoside hydrolase family 55 protein, partial [Verrucomicrobiae bacterium]|nr:glycoside hydrolase family 55 protein [Verrucomicrobiae bacterium]
AVVLTQKERQCLYVRDLVLGGYKIAIQQAERQPVPGPRVAEYLNYPPIVAVAGTPARTLRLEIKDAPVVPTFPPEQWANVNSFGAKGDGETDDSVAIQKAMRSGKPVIYFPSSVYVITNTVEVPATVHRIELLGASIVRKEWAVERVAFRIAEKSQHPILITDSGNPVPTGIAVPRTVVYRNMSGTIHTWARPSVDTFLENCSHIGHYQSFCIKGQRTWGRGLNNETGAGSHYFINGGALWVLGFKTQHIYCPAFEVLDGGRLEVLGGGANVIQGDLTVAPMIVVKDSEASVIMFTDATGPFGNIVEGRKGQNITLRHDQFPRRFANQPHSLFIPLYYGKP